MQYFRDFRQRQQIEVFEHGLSTLRARFNYANPEPFQGRIRRPVELAPSFDLGPG